MFDERARYGRRLRRLRRGARRWSVVAGMLAAATAVLAPYAGLSVIDAVWAAAAGGSAVLAAWRWADYRALAGQPVVVERVDQLPPWGRQVITGLRRHADRYRLRGSAIAPAWHRLDRAAAVLDNLAVRPDSPTDAALREAAAAERSLRTLARRAAAVQRGLPYVQGRQSVGLTHGTLVAQFEQGVTAYEDLVGAAVACVAEEGRTTPDHEALGRLLEATDLLRGTAMGFAELRPEQSTLDLLAP